MELTSIIYNPLSDSFLIKDVHLDRPVWRPILKYEVSEFRFRTDQIVSYKLNRQRYAEHSNWVVKTEVGTIRVPLDAENIEELVKILQATGKEAHLSEALVWAVAIGFVVILVFIHLAFFAA